MTNSGVFIADLEEGCPAAAFWIDYFDHLTLPLLGQKLADAQATVAAAPASLLARRGRRR